MATQHEPIPPGTLDMLILQTLARRGELHGFEIAEAIEQASAHVLQVEEGSLYPALQRMLIKGLVVAEWGRTAENRRARYYRVTSLGRRHVGQQVDAYRRVSIAIERILQPAY
jgi:PadR family transcriptional regulator, regulatory protein PadR